MAVEARQTFREPGECPHGGSPVQPVDLASSEIDPDPRRPMNDTVDDQPDPEDRYEPGWRLSY